MRHELRGLSPIVAVVMLILIAIAASVLVYVWMSGLVASTPTTEPALQERIKIEAVVLNDTDDTPANGTEDVTVYIRNIGDVVIDTVTVYVINATDNNVTCTFTVDNLQLQPGKVKPVRRNTDAPTKPCWIDKGETYIVKVVTPNGAEASYTAVARWN